MTDSLHELCFSRLIAAPRHALWRCWTEPELIKLWFTPRPWTTPVVEVDVRPGGRSHMIFRGPDGEEFPNDGVYLEVVPPQRLVFTDAYVEAWRPSSKPFITAITTIRVATPRPIPASEHPAMPEMKPSLRRARR